MGSIPITRSISEDGNFSRVHGVRTLRLLIRPLPEDPKQRTLIERYLLSVCAYVLGVMSAWTAKAVGLISLGYTALTVASFLIVVYVVAVYCIYRSGLNRRFQDSALTRVQMLVAIAWCSYFISGVQALRGVALMLYLFIAMFSFFTLNPRQTAQIVLLISLAYGVIISWDWWRAAPGFDLTLNLIQWVILSIMLLGLWMIARYTSQVREDIHRSTQLIKDQNRQITQTNAELNDALARLNQLAITDELTGLSNRRHFLSTVERHIARCRGNQLTFGLCLLDLDHFKRVNDEYGHQVGDTVLASCARVLLDHMREYDFLARFGGEELVLIVTRGDEAVTRMCAERLRRAVENAGIGAIAPGIELTVSVGATVFRAGDTLEEALGRSDKAMYEAKRGGRNITIFRAS